MRSFDRMYGFFFSSFIIQKRISVLFSFNFALFAWGINRNSRNSKMLMKKIEKKRQRIEQRKKNEENCRRRNDEMKKMKMKVRQQLLGPAKRATLLLLIDHWHFNNSESSIPFLSIDFLFCICICMCMCVLILSCSFSTFHLYFVGKFEAQTIRFFSLPFPLLLLFVGLNRFHYTCEILLIKDALQRHHSLEQLFSSFCLLYQYLQYCGIEQFPVQIINVVRFFLSSLLHFT